MRWLVGWSSDATGFHTVTAADPGRPTAGTVGHPDEGRTVQPVGSQLLWGDPDPLWAVGDWRPDEIRVVTLEQPPLPGQFPGHLPPYPGPGQPSAAVIRMAVLGCCAAGDDELRAALVTARGGALRHLTTWSGSYTVVLQAGRRITVVGDLAGARPVFHTPWDGGTAYATAALPLADLIEAQLDIGHLAALLACPESPEALGDSTPYEGVRRIPPGHALILREGSREITGYEPTASLAVAGPRMEADRAVDGVRDALVDAVRARLTAPRHAPGALPADPGPVPGMGPADRRARRGAPTPGIGADLSGGSASGTLALLAAGLPGRPGTVKGHGTGAGERLTAVTYNDLTEEGREAELERARALADDPRLHHVVVAAGEEGLPYAGLENGPLTDEPAPSLVLAERHRGRLAAGSADHFTGAGARQVLDAHPARLADLLLDRRRRHLLRPVAALARAEGGSPHSVFVPLTVYRAARRLARTPYRTGLETAAGQLTEANRPAARAYSTGPVGASLAALAWSRPGPAARWLTGEALAEVAVRLTDAATRPGVVPAGGPRPGEARARAALNRHAADQRILEQAAEVRSQRLHAPFLDNQVVRACRDLPESLRVRPGARADILRTVLAGAGVHALPPGWGTPTHVSSAETARKGLRASLPQLMALFDVPLLADAGLVEARVVRKALRAASEGEALPLDGLADLVATELWLRRLLSRRGTCWTGTAAPRRRAVAGGVPPRPSLRT
ncbi:asparagine synthase-related protein [Streptomyces yaizuensis]|uniref:Asparagine synthase-related protein n=1 Tax=Streptomyces yaizuensis TaxID=2989713 RepID=A0ABQ5P1L5_9ACTN|nr:asparagine synthase-related protein [Streptomyces sp. YSPA8]GLF96490.1 asparagine synthase-related protein [Streptomyces sp. YSPA8]